MDKELLNRINRVTIMNISKRWAIVDEKGNVIDTFRTNATAVQFLPHLKDVHLDKSLRIIKYVIPE